MDITSPTKTKVPTHLEFIRSEVLDTENEFLPSCKHSGVKDPKYEISTQLKPGI
jgi:hypothetical protein